MGQHKGGLDLNGDGLMGEWHDGMMA